MPNYYFADEKRRLIETFLTSLDQHYQSFKKKRDSFELAPIEPYYKELKEKLKSLRDTEISAPDRDIFQKIKSAQNQFNIAVTKHLSNGQQLVRHVSRFISQITSLFYSKFYSKNDRLKLATPYQVSVVILPMQAPLTTGQPSLVSVVG